MPRSRKSQRKLDRKATLFDPRLHSRNDRIYNGYFGGLLLMLDDDFQNNQYRIKHWLGQKLAKSVGKWHLAPRNPISGRYIFTLIQQHENRNFWGYGTANPLPLQHCEYAAFMEVSERLRFGYVDYANYYLRKEQQVSLRSGERYHPSHHTPVEIVYFEDHLLYGN